MHKILLAVLLMCSTAAYAEEPAKAPPAAGGDKKVMERPEMTFEERKAKALEHMAKRKAEMAKREACVQAATDGEALKACFPNRGGHEGGWGGKRRHRGGGEGGEGGDAGGPPPQ